MIVTSRIKNVKLKECEREQGATVVPRDADMAIGKFSKNDCPWWDLMVKISPPVSILQAECQTVRQRLSFYF